MNLISTILLPICLEACKILQPLINTIHESMNQDSFQIKSDNSTITFADIIVQSLLKKLLKHFTIDFIGEESIEYDFKNHCTVGKNKIKSDIILHECINETRDAIIKLCNINIPNSDLIKELNLIAIIDPLDGTSEFIKKGGKQSTICIGFAKCYENKYLPEAGLIFRPICDRTEYAMGCKSENFKFDTLIKHDYCNNLFLTSYSISIFINKLLEKNYIRTPACGVGNKILMLLEKGSIYLQDRGVSRWDTCASQAILEAYGGVLCKLTDYIEAIDNVNILEIMKSSSYNYAVSNINLDANRIARFSSMNSVDDITIEKNVQHYDKINMDEQHVVIDIIKNNIDKQHFINGMNEYIKPYSNLCGLIALTANFLNDKESMILLQKNIKQVITKYKPKYD